MASKLETSRDGSIMFMKGTLIEPGIYRGIDGATVQYDGDVLENGKLTARSIPIIYRHTEEKDGKQEMKELTVGNLSSVNSDGKGQLTYTGYVWDDRVFPFVQDATFDAVSPEIDIDGVVDPTTGVVMAKTVSFEALALTNHTKRGIDTASIDSHKVVHVSLERKVDNIMTDEETWNKLPEDFRLSQARKLLEGKGLVLLEKDKVPTADPKVAELSAKLEGMGKELSYFQDKELGALVNDIKAVDAEFDTKAFLEGAVDFAAKKARLEAHSKMLGRLIPKIKLELSGSPKPNTEEVIENRKVALETYGEVEAKRLLPELFK